jgi:hypothetical protein
MEGAHQVFAPQITGRGGVLSAVAPLHCWLIARVVMLEVSREQFLEAPEVVGLVGLDPHV